MTSGWCRITCRSSPLCCCAITTTAADDGSGVPKPCAVSGRTITCDLGPMVLSETRFITITVRGNRAGSITNTASVEATGDNNDSNDSDDKTVQVRQLGQERCESLHAVYS